MKILIKKLILSVLLTATSLSLFSCTVFDLFALSFQKAKTYVDASTYETDYRREESYIFFGTYPQSEVTDSSLILKLNETVKNTPPAEKYYDITYYENKYRGVLSDVEIIWFKYEPIKWKILSESNGEALLISDMLLDIQNCNVAKNNNYAESSIRNWLNSTFIETAFSSAEQNKIKIVSVDNSVSTTGYQNNTYVCDNTYDKVFLLSYEDATNNNYGLHSSSSRIKKMTAYAKLQCDASNSNIFRWWLRSPHYGDDSYVQGVTDNGIISFFNVTNTGGVAPALHLTL